MRHGKSRCAAIVEVDSDNIIIYAYALYIEDASRRELYRAYSEWLLDYVNDGELIEVRVADLTANDPKRGQPYERIKYFNDRRIITHSFLNWIASRALHRKESEEVKVNDERTEKEIRAKEGKTPIEKRVHSTNRPASKTEADRGNPGTVIKTKNRKGVFYMTVKFDTKENVVKAFMQLGAEGAEITRSSDAVKFQTEAISRGYEVPFADYLAKAIAGTWTATETLDAIDVFINDNPKKEEEGADNK
ncbi:hypothetical protein ACFSFY_02505 [Sporosarcina siberiensis]|uniref:Uncharacterized protein n=1 Tax=Sporosarcina siberiensis TaxID=1365606 RepID=A0ABW4SBU7_9BACL